MPLGCLNFDLCPLKSTYPGDEPTKIDTSPIYMSGLLCRFLIFSVKIFKYICIYSTYWLYRSDMEVSDHPAGQPC